MAFVSFSCFHVSFCFCFFHIVFTLETVFKSYRKEKFAVSIRIDGALILTVSYQMYRLISKSLFLDLTCECRFYTFMNIKTKGYGTHYIKSDLTLSRADKSLQILGTMFVCEV